MINDTINKQTLGEIVVSKIKKHIIDNDLKAGDRLPTEQEMADNFGVSRLSVREATKTLNFLGIIDSAPKRGLTVGKFVPERLNEYLGFHFALNNYPKERLLAARMVIETGIIPYYIESFKKNPDIYNQLNDICNKLEHCNDVDEYIEWDIKFHSALVQASGIEPLIMFNDLLQIFFKKFRLEVAMARKNWKQSTEGHREILESLKAGKLSIAETLLREHLCCYEGTL